MKEPTEKTPSKGLRRLDEGYYQGENWVHWSMTIDRRRTGWLNESTHARIREALLHTLIRYRLICPVYCLMPDHGHFLWGGLSEESHQWHAVKFFRQEWNRILKSISNDRSAWKLQHQPYDHVLRKDERKRENGFPRVAAYILENPVRAGLVKDFQSWKFLGSVVPAYPRIHPAENRFWERYWDMHYHLRDS